ncbi:MAG: hypothetical protein V3R57_07900 [Candidatus Bathyarchaeia archaeon]
MNELGYDWHGSKPLRESWFGADVAGNDPSHHCVEQVEALD